MSRGAEVTSGNVNWCAMPKQTDIPQLWSSSNLGLESRNQRQNEWTQVLWAQWGPVGGGIMGNNQIGRRLLTQWFEEGSSESVARTCRRRGERRRRAGELAKKRCSQALGGSRGEVMCRSGKADIRWGVWEGFEGGRQGHRGHLLQGWRQCVLESTGALFSILSSKPWKTWVSPKTSLSIWREVRSVSQRDLTDSTGSWLNGSPLLPDLRRCFTPGLTMWLYKAVQVRFDGSLKYVFRVRIFWTWKAHKWIQLKQENNEIPTRVHEHEELRDPGLCEAKEWVSSLKRGSENHGRMRGQVGRQI